MTAAEVKAALRRRHPASNGAVIGPGAWTCLEEFDGIDLLAVCAWRRYKGFRGESPIVGYEVKVSRSDMRQELLHPSKRALAVARCSQFFFAVPDGLLTALELEWLEPDWDPRDFQREDCPAYCEAPGRARRRRRVLRGSLAVDDAPVGYGKWTSVELPEAERPNTWTTTRWVWEPCATCGGKGYLTRSKVEQEAPTLWVPKDVGLVSVSKRGCHVLRDAPRREPQALSRYTVAQLVRWASYRPDTRHAGREASPELEEDADADAA